jgi:hypothetical protein
LIQRRLGRGDFLRQREKPVILLRLQGTALPIRQGKQEGKTVIELWP